MVHREKANDRRTTFSGGFRGPRSDEQPFKPKIDWVLWKARIMLVLIGILVLLTPKLVTFLAHQG